MDCLCSLYLISSKTGEKKELLLFFPWSLSLDLNYYPKFLHIMAQIPNLLVCYWFVCILCFNELDVTRARHVSKIDYILVSVSHSIYWCTRLKPCPVANTKPRDILVIVCCLANQFLFLVIDWWRYKIQLQIKEPEPELSRIPSCMIE